MKLLFKLLAGVLLAGFALVAQATEHNAITQGPLYEAKKMVLNDATQRGALSNPNFQAAMQQFEVVTARHPFDLGLVFDCQTNDAEALAIMADRVAAFAAINAAVLELQLYGSHLQAFVPVNGASHATAFQAVEQVWPQLRALPLDTLARAGVVNEVAALRALEAQYGTLSHDFGTPEHYTVQHPAAATILAVQAKVEASWQSAEQWAIAAVVVVLLLLLGWHNLAIRRDRQLALAGDRL